MKARSSPSAATTAAKAAPIPSEAAPSGCGALPQIQRGLPQAGKQAPEKKTPPRGGCGGPPPRDCKPPPRRLQARQLRKQQSRPKAAAGPCPEDSDAAPRAALAGPCRREKAREPPVGSAASYPPEGFPLSTFGDGGLNCRVRDGTGCAPSSMAADPPGGSCESSSRAGTLAASIARKTHVDP